RGRPLEQRLDRTVHRRDTPRAAQPGQPNRTVDVRRVDIPADPLDQDVAVVHRRDIDGRITRHPDLDVVLDSIAVPMVAIAVAVVADSSDAKRDTAFLALRA